MDDYKDLIISAEKRIRLADHIATQTYPLLKDSKLLLSAVNNLVKASEEAIKSVLNYERLYKRIRPFSDNFEQMYSLFEMKIVPRYRISKSIILYIRKIREITEQHKSASVEFTRKNKFVMCNDSYNMKSITLKEIKNYINDSKLLIDSCKLILKKNE